MAKEILGNGLAIRGFGGDNLIELLPAATATNRQELVEVLANTRLNGWPTARQRCPSSLIEKLLKWLAGWTGPVASVDRIKSDDEHTLVIIIMMMMTNVFSTRLWSVNP